MKSYIKCDINSISSNLYPKGAIKHLGGYTSEKFRGGKKMTYREALYNLATVAAKAKENSKINLDKLDHQAAGKAWDDLVKAIEKEPNDTVDSSKEEWLQTRMDLAAASGTFEVVLQCPFETDKPGEKITESELSKFAKAHNLDFDANHVIAGIVLQKISFDKK